MAVAPGSIAYFGTYTVDEADKMIMPLVATKYIHKSGWSDLSAHQPDAVLASRDLLAEVRRHGGASKHPRCPQC
jgi:hypothetical protein